MGQGLAQSTIIVIGAGPAGLFASRYLASSGVQVVLLNRDVKPGGLAEYGIYYDKYRMKEGLRRQFRQILDLPLITYYGNIQVGQHSDISLAELRGMGFPAVLVTVGAQGTKWLGLPGEEYEGVYHAKDLVYHYNQLPPFSQKHYAIGQRVALIGAGNVMMDIAHWLIRDVKVAEVIAVVRRGPAEVKFTKKEMEAVARNLDLVALDKEFGRVSPAMLGIGQNVEAAKEFFLSGMAKALEANSATRFRFDFLASPARVIGDENGHVRGLEVEDTSLAGDPADPRATRLGSKRVIDVETVVFCIGDKVDDDFGLPVRWNEFVKHPKPGFPINGISYEAFDAEEDKALTGIFIAGWAREASNGLVGVARKDGESAAQAIINYLQTLTLPEENAGAKAWLERRLKGLQKPVISKTDLIRLDEAERAEAQRCGLEAFKYSSNQEMFVAMDLI